MFCGSVRGLYVVTSSRKTCYVAEEQVLMNWITGGREDYSWWQHPEHTLKISTSYFTFKIPKGDISYLICSGMSVHKPECRTTQHEVIKRKLYPQFNPWQALKSSQSNSYAIVWFYGKYQTFSLVYTSKKCIPVFWMPIKSKTKTKSGIITSNL